MTKAKKPPSDAQLKQRHLNNVQRHLSRKLTDVPKETLRAVIGVIEQDPIVHSYLATWSPNTRAPAEMVEPAIVERQPQLHDTEAQARIGVQYSADGVTNERGVNMGTARYLPGDIHFLDE